MADDGAQLLNWQASDLSTNGHAVTELPAEVKACLQNARFLHLATCHDSFPHISLMNYTYLASTPFHPGPVIIMTTNLASKKALNLVQNPRVSLLVHDWVMQRPPTCNTDPNVQGSSPPSRPAQSSLANLLLDLNTSALGRISATINGKARFLLEGSDEEKWCKSVHLENNTFGGEKEVKVKSEGVSFGASYDNPENGKSCFIEGEEVRVIVVDVQHGRIADWKGGLEDWHLVQSNAA